jgi:hypothetical protein
MNGRGRAMNGRAASMDSRRRVMDSPRLTISDRRGDDDHTSQYKLLHCDFTFWAGSREGLNRNTIRTGGIGNYPQFE